MHAGLEAAFLGPPAFVCRLEAGGPRGYGPRLALMNEPGEGCVATVRGPVW